MKILFLKILENFEWAGLIIYPNTFYFLKNIYLFILRERDRKRERERERERECAQAGDGQRQRERENSKQALWFCQHRDQCRAQTHKP